MKNRTATENVTYWVNAVGGLPEGDMLWLEIVSDLARRIDALESPGGSVAEGTAAVIGNRVNPDGTHTLELDMNADLANRIWAGPHYVHVVVSPLK